MSWWGGASQLTNFASSALKEAQKKIDKVLDISEAEGQASGWASGGGFASADPDGFFTEYLAEPQASPKETSAPEKEATPEKTETETTKSSASSVVDEEEEEDTKKSSGWIGGWGFMKKQKGSRDSSPASVTKSGSRKSSVDSTKLGARRGSKDEKASVQGLRTQGESREASPLRLGTKELKVEEEEKDLGVATTDVGSVEKDDDILLIGKDSEGTEKAPQALGSGWGADQEDNWFGMEDNKEGGGAGILEAPGTLAVSSEGWQDTESSFMSMTGSSIVQLEDSEDILGASFQNLPEPSLNVGDGEAVPDLHTDGDAVKQIEEEESETEAGEGKGEGAETVRTAEQGESEDGDFIQEKAEEQGELSGQAEHEEAVSEKLESVDDEDEEEIVASATDMKELIESSLKESTGTSLQESTESSLQGSTESSLQESTETNLKESTDSTLESSSNSTLTIEPEGDVVSDGAGAPTEDAGPPSEDRMIVSTASTASFVQCTAADAEEGQLQMTSVSADGLHERADTESPEDVRSASRGSDGDVSAGSGGSSLVKVDSADEHETCTSSDIEIISMPSTTSEPRLQFSIDVTSPLRHAFTQSAKSQSSSPDSVDSPGPPVTPSPREDEVTDDAGGWAGDGGEEAAHDKVQPRVAELREDGESLISDSTSTLVERSVESEEEMGPLHPQKLLTKLAEVSEVLDARERKLVEMSKEIVDLRETNTVLRSQLDQLEEEREAKLEDINQLTAEFAVRLSDMETKLQQAIKEKDRYKAQLGKAEKEMMARCGATADAVNLLAEKEQQIQELLQEGEKLSKEQLKSSTIIKKLRAGQKEGEEALTKTKQKLEKKTEELEKLKTVLDSKIDMEKAQGDAINQLNSAVKKQEKEITSLKTDLEDTQERCRGLQTNLDATYKEISEMHKEQATRDSKAHVEAESAGEAVRQQMKAAMEQNRHKLLLEQEALRAQMEELQLQVSRAERETSRREDILRQELVDANTRLQEAESRNEDLVSSVSASTRPLLRQLENLQTSHSAQQSSWDTLERGMTERIGDLQTQLSRAVESERSANDRQQESTARLGALEGQVTILRQERATQAAQITSLETNVRGFEDDKHRREGAVEAAKSAAASEVSTVRRTVVALENKLEQANRAVLMEQNRSKHLADTLMEKERQLAQAIVSPVTAHTPTPSRQASVTSDLSSTQDELLQHALGGSGALSRSLYDSVRGPASSAVLEGMESRLRLKEGEVSQLHSDARDMEATRDVMARRLVDLTNKAEEQETQLEDLPKLQAQLKEVSGRYEALQVMYGEQVEMAEELRLDLQDVKEMYKAQIEQLVGKG